MTDEAKRFLNLKEDAQALREIEWTDCAMNPRVCTTMMHKAADLIESLAAELEHAGRERDALLRDLRDADQCGCEHCKHYKHCLAEEAEDAYEDYDYVCSACGRDDCPCKTCAGCSNWEWRGAE